MDIQWSLVLFTALTGAGGWMLACLAAAECANRVEKSRFAVGITGLALTIVGGCASVTHLSHPGRMLEALNHPTSGIFIEAVLTGLVVAFAAIYLILLKKSTNATATKAFAVLAAVAGVALSFMAGSSYMMASIPSWNTILLPLGYLGSAMAAGATGFLVILSLQKEDPSEMRGFSSIALAANVIGLVTTIAYLLIKVPTANILWHISIFVLFAAAAAASFLAYKKPGEAPVTSVISFCCAAVGCVAFRCSMWATLALINNFFQLL